MAISARLSLMEGGGALFTRDSERVQAVMATMMGHLLMLKMLRVQDSYFSLGLDSEIKEREEEYRAAWPNSEYAHLL